MPTFTDTAEWVASVPTLAFGLQATGGDENANMNVPMRDLNRRLVYLRGRVDALSLDSVWGTGDFDPVDGFTVTHDLGTTAYHVTCLPTSNPGGELGEVWIEIGENAFTIHNTGSWTGPLRWGLVRGTQFGG